MSHRTAALLVACSLAAPASAQHAGHSGPSAGGHMARVRERRSYVVRHPIPTRGDKSVRAQSIRGRMALEGLRVPKPAPWRQAFEAELLSFPAGRHDDQVDALGLVGQLLDKMVRGTVLKRDEPDRRDGYTRMFEEAEAQNAWRVV